MKKEKKENKKSVSSGAEKVETLTKEITQDKGGEETSVKSTKKVKKEEGAAARRVQAAQQKKARKEKSKAQREEKRRQRARAIANKRQEKERRQKERSSARKNGNGGWIAAVSVLGVTTLALTSALTVGAVEMKRSNDGTMTAYRGTMYELTGIMEHVDDDLERARISASPEQQSRILTDLLVQSRMAEMDLEKLPITAESDRGITSFLNRTAWECERMLAKLRHGESLTGEDFARLESLYKTNHAIRTELDKTLAEMTDESLQEFIKKGSGGIADGLRRMEKSTLEENRERMKEDFDKMKDKMRDFSKKAGDVSRSNKDAPHIESARAEELCKGYFADYDIAEYQCVGEATGRGFSAYNVQGYDKKGTLLFAEISQTDGALLRFDYYEDCSAETFDLQNAERIAQEFVQKLGYDDMEIVNYRENGTTTEFIFVYEEDDVAYYPDEVRVKVCRSRGLVTGFDATRYLKNHRERVAPNVQMSMDEAQNKLHEKLSVESARLAVVKTVRGEKTAYEFLCSYQDENYFVYLDAMTGEELSIINAKGIY